MEHFKRTSVTKVKWSLKTLKPIFRVLTHENSVTALQFDHRCIITSSSDGKVKLWDTQNGKLIRQLGDQSEAVWRVHMSEAMAVAVQYSAGMARIEV